MTISRERIGALFFLVLSIAYGYLASEIRLHPGDEYEAMNARTLPYVLSAMGVVLSFALLLGGRHEATTGKLSALNWRPVIVLLGLTLLYGFAIDWLGFLLSTTLFLIAGFRTLGERRIKVLLLVAVPFVFIFWFGLTQLLDIYLAPGRIFTG